MIHPGNWDRFPAGRNLCGCEICDDVRRACGCGSCSGGAKGIAGSPGEALLTKREVAARLNTSLYAVEQVIKKGLLPVVPVGSRVRIRPADLDAYIRNMRKVNPEGPGNVKSITKVAGAIGRKGTVSESDLSAILSAGPPGELLKAQRDNAVRFFAERNGISVKKARKLLRHRGKTVSRGVTERGTGVDDRFGGTADSVVAKLAAEARAVQPRQEVPSPGKATYAHPFVNPYAQ